MKATLAGKEWALANAPIPIMHEVTCDVALIKLPHDQRAAAIRALLLIDPSLDHTNNHPWLTNMSFEIDQTRRDLINSSYGGAISAVKRLERQLNRNYGAAARATFHTNTRQLTVRIQFEGKAFLAVANCR